MAVIQRTELVAAGDVNENLVAGSAFEFVRSRAVVSMSIVSTDNTGDTFITIQIGSRIIAEEFVPLVGTDFPNTDAGFYYNAGALAGDRIVIRARNADAADQTFRVLVQITEV